MEIIANYEIPEPGWAVVVLKWAIGVWQVAANNSGKLYTLPPGDLDTEEAAHALAQRYAEMYRQAWPEPEAA